VLGLFIIFWIVIGGGGGFAIGISKGRRLEGFILGLLLSVIGWIITALLPPKSSSVSARVVNTSTNSSVQIEDRESKTCPWCAEVIRDAAVICRYCGRDVANLDDGGKSTIDKSYLSSMEAGTNLQELPIRETEATQHLGESVSSEGHTLGAPFEVASHLPRASQTKKIWTFAIVVAIAAVLVGVLNSSHGSSDSGWGPAKNVANIPQGTYGAQGGDISCYGTINCAISWGNGQLTWGAGIWSSWGTLGGGGPDENYLLDGYGALISCVSTQDCVGVDDYGDAFYITDKLPIGGIHLGAAQIPLNDSVISLSCSSRTFCAIVTYEGRADILRNLKWSPIETVDPKSVNHGGITSVSCPSQNYCVAVDGNGDTLTYKNGKWSSPKSIDPESAKNFLGGLSSISCVNDNFCVAVDSIGNMLTDRSGRWSKPASIDGTEQLTSVSCATVAFCMAVDAGGNAVRYSSGAWQAPVPSNLSLTSVSCPSVSLCFAVDPSGFVIRYRRSSASKS
jgi:hypothetical protein